MNKIDEIRTELMQHLWCDDRSDIVDAALKIITPYLSHGTTEEEARAKLLVKWDDHAGTTRELNLDYIDELIDVLKEKRIITSSHEPIAEPENNARRAYNIAIDTDESETHTAYPQCIDLKDELELLVEELEAHARRAR